MGEKGLFQMRKHHGIEYNIFQLSEGTYEYRVFDRNRRVYCKSKPIDTVERAINVARADCELYAKGMCVLGILVDEGKPIRDKEDKEYMQFKKEMRKQNRGK